VTKCSDVVEEHAASGCLNPLNTELNPICHLLALLGARLILHVSRIRVNDLRGYWNDNGVKD
jgi:hypothetical protein